MRMLEHPEVKMKEHTRVALLEQSIGHINETLIRIETRLDKMDAKIDFNFNQLNGKIDSTSNQLNGKIDSNLKWMLGVYFAGFGALFGMLAHIQHWF